MRSISSWVLSFGACVALCVALTACSTKQAGDVDSERIAKAEGEPDQWLSLGRTWKADRFSPLKRIDEKSVEKLGFAWEYEFRSHRGRVEHGQEATPIVVDGVVYVSGPWGSVAAVDAKTGKARWRYDPQVDGSYNRKACCDVVNRGVQVWQGKVYVATLDGSLVSLDAATGKENWKVDTFIDRDQRSYTITGPPQVAKNVVVIGNSGAEFGVRGYVTAYDLATGKQRWRFYTVPGDPAKGPPEHPEMEMALKTWDPKSDWASGLGGTVWGEMNYDPELDLLYVGTGNASPLASWFRSPSGGDNLFLVSILAIKPETGKLAWYYQQTPGEIWDYTATMNMILADLTIDGRLRKVIMQAPKNGYFYVLDRGTGEFISAKPYVFANWASSIDAKGVPTINPAAIYKDKSALVYPTGAGGHNWPPMAFNPQLGLVYIPARESGMFMTSHAVYEWKKGQTNAGHSAVFSFLVDLMSPPERHRYDAFIKEHPELPNPSTRELLIAYDPIAQKERWRVPTGHAEFGAGGVLTTATNLVVQGSTGGSLVVFRGDTGEKLKEIEVGTGIMAAPVSYEIDGEQYIAVLASVGGGGMSALYPSESAPHRYQNYGRLLAFKLGGGAVPLPPKREPGQTPEPPVLADVTPDMIGKGAPLFYKRCVLCHGGRGDARLSAYPDLFRLSPETHASFEKIVYDGALAANGMASFADVLSKDDVKAIHAFIVAEQAKLRGEEQASKK